MNFIGNLENRTTLLADTVSNPVPINGFLPEDKNRILAELRKMRENIGEAELQTYRRNIRSL